MDNVGNSSLCIYSNDSEDTLLLNTIKPALALLSLVSCLLAIVTLFCYKLHRSFNYRLIIYWLSASVLVSGVFVVHLPIAWYSPSNQALVHHCMFLAFAVFCSSSAMALMALFVTVEVCLLIICSMSLDKYEVPGVVLCFVLPLLFGWIPFVTDSYGFIDLRCGIVTRDENCDVVVTSLVETTVLAKLPACMLASSCFILLFIAIVSFALQTWRLKQNQRNGHQCPERNYHARVDQPCCLKDHDDDQIRRVVRDENQGDRNHQFVCDENQDGQNQRHSQYRRALKEILPMIVFAAIYIAASVVGGVTRLVGLALDYIPLWLSLADAVVQSSVGTLAIVCLVCHLLIQRMNSHKRGRIRVAPEQVEVRHVQGTEKMTDDGSPTVTWPTAFDFPCETDIDREHESL